MHQKYVQKFQKKNMIINILTFLEIKFKMKEVVKIISNELNVKKVEFIDNKKDENHYLVNPYTYKLRKGINLKLFNQIDFINGIKKIIKEIKNKKNNV